jgi:hypothetical protein
VRNPLVLGQNVAEIMDKGDLNDGCPPAVQSDFQHEPIYETTLKLLLREFYDHQMAGITLAPGHIFTPFGGQLEPKPAICQ